MGGDVQVTVTGIVIQRGFAIGMIQIGSWSGADDGRVARDTVRSQMGHFRRDLVRIFSWSQIGG